MRQLAAANNQAMRLKGKECKERAKNKGTGGHHGSKKRIAKRTKSTFVATATTTTCFYRLAVYRQFQEEHLSKSLRVLVIS